MFLSPSQQYFSHIGTELGCIYKDLGGISTEQRIKCLAQGHNTVPWAGHDLATPQSQI